MRLELAGSLVHPPPLVIKFESNLNFDVAHYISLGYTHFDVICIGAGGGMGGGIDTANSGTLVRNYGGAGGGGGFHRVRGLLSALSIPCPVVIGVGGAVGNDHSSLPASTTNGADGGYSSFNTDTCKASGGKGGKKVASNSLTVSTDADGGEGGKGNRLIAGGGAAGGQAGTPTISGPDFPGSDGADGTLFQNVGEGGGGGAGGVGKYGTGTTHNAATSGGRGAYNPGDTSVYGPGDEPGHDIPSGAQNIVPGGASGAKASPVNGLPTVYGQSMGTKLPGAPGTVIIRLTAE